MEVRAAPLPLSSAISGVFTMHSTIMCPLTLSSALRQLHAAGAIVAQFILVSEDAEAWRG